MFESAELGHRIDKLDYKREVPSLRESLLDTQYELLDKKAFPLVVVIAGVDGAGKGETVNVLSAWMDARHIQSHALDAPTDEELERPPMWRFWRQLPPKGKTGIFFGSWYTEPIVERARGRWKDAELDQATEEIKRFERMLANEGALLLKFWFHLSKDEQKKRLEKLERRARTRWRVTSRDWDNFKRYDKFRLVSERVLRQTDAAEAPWMVVEGLDPRYRTLTVAKTLRDSLRRRLDEPTHAAQSHAAPVVPSIDERNVLRELDLGKSLDKETYETELERLQRKLSLLTRDTRFKDLSVVAAFEGADAAGKGGAIRRITGALDARQYRVTPIAAPTEEERAQPYLWRFWRHLPRRGHIQIFDRSWYGRVLVERVEGFCSASDYLRAYGEINDFEEQLVRARTVLVKYWLHISQEEQLARFKAREETGFKRFKITEEDWRNREKWDL
ncbi:MAG TPA: polyphosphate:AMP phosphotransferase, partial [Minicystis sp.]|nr:polyphosphate:AMP phosphotransferase [Minicystis sp.]